MPKSPTYPFYLQKHSHMQASSFNLRLTVPANQPFDVSFLAIAAKNAGYILNNQKVYTSDKTGDTLVYLYFDRQSTTTNSQNRITGL